MKVYIETLGCPKNEVDSQMAAGMLEGAGFERTFDPAQAEVILVNTCAFIQDAKEESIDTIFEMARYKEGRCRLLAVTGCLGQRYCDELYRQMPEADLIIGVNDYAQLPELIEETLKKGRRKQRSLDCGVFEEFPGITAGIKNASAYLKIAEGCNNCCTYCVIPQIRGGYRSRKKEEVLEEARALAAQGAKELVLIAQDVTNYGRDFGDGYELPDLLQDLAKIDGVKWIRLMYCYPDKITKRLAEEIRDNPKVCKYIDMPVQHGSDDILKAMNRRSTKAQIQKVVRMLRKEVPGIVIRTTIIVGFPGERAAQFDELYDFIEEMRFDRMGVFTYSKEENTPAGQMKPQVRRDVKERRRDALMQLQQEISLENNRKRIGEVCEVLVEEGPDEENGYLGRTSQDAAEIDNAVIFSSRKKLEHGSFVRVKITDAFDYDLTGEVLG